MLAESTSARSPGLFLATARGPIHISYTTIRGRSTDLEAFVELNHVTERILREKRRFRQDEIAAGTRLSPQTISATLLGHRRNGATQERIADYLGLDAATLWGRWYTGSRPKGFDPRRACTDGGRGSGTDVQAGAGVGRAGEARPPRPAISVVAGGQ